MTQTIILGYDGSPCAQAALDAAVELASGCPDSKIVIVHGAAVNLAAGAGPMTAELLLEGAADVRSRAEAGMKPLMDEAAARVAAAGVAVETRVEWKTASAALMDVAEELGANMIVVGTYGAGALRGVLLGSTPYKLLHRSEIPVLVVPHRH